MTADTFNPETDTTPETATLIERLEKVCSFWWCTGREWVAEIPTGDGIHATFVTETSLIALCKSVNS